MNYPFVLLSMVFLHILDDFVFQAPCLCSLKQESYWKENAPDEKYKHDYIWALIMHSFSWSFMIMLPIAYVSGFNINYGFTIIFAINVAIHALVDNTKANWRLINLWQDQLAHIVQILLTSLLIFC